MGLRQRQSEFAQAAALLIQKADELGYSVTLGCAWRNPAVFGEFGQTSEAARGHSRSTSVHKLRMALDLNLFDSDGEYIRDDTGHKVLGKWWERTFKEFDACWGGRFNDPNHYSFRIWGSA